MPGGDGTGPLGGGPMTGRALGYCAGYGMPGGWRGPGFGFGRGFRGGRRGRFRGPGVHPWAAWGQGYWPAQHPAYFGPPSRAEQQEMLQSQIEYLEDALQELKQRQSELEAQQQKSQSE